MADDQDIPEQAPQVDPGDPLQKLYNGLHSDGSYTKSFDEFKKDYNNPAAIDKLYNGLHSDGSFTKTKDEFYNAYFPAQKTAPIKAQSPQEFLSAQQPQQSVTDQPTSPVQQIQHREGLDLSQDPLAVASRQHYQTLRDQAISEVESPGWKNKIFTGKVPALTTDPNMPAEAFQEADPKAVEDYLNTKGLGPKDRYWLRNQILNYSKDRQGQYYVNQKAEPVLQGIPEVKAAQDHATQLLQSGQITSDDYEKTWMGEVAKDPAVMNHVNQVYTAAGHQYDAQRTQAIANRLNNVGIGRQPLAQNAPFHDQITGTNKVLMGAINAAGDLGGQVSSLLELGGSPQNSALGYQLKTAADNLKASNVIPQTGEGINYIAGQVVPMALDMAAIGALSGAVGGPIYEALAGARAAGTIGKFAEGMLGGVAVSPANSYLMAHAYYNDLIKQGLDPDQAASKSDQLLAKNFTTDMLMTPLQMGLLKMPMGNVWQKLGAGAAEGLVSGTHFALQDFNQKSTDNPAMHILDYVTRDPDAAKTFISGAVLGGLQKAAVDKLHNWQVDRATNTMFSFGRQYDNGDNKLLPSNQTIANNVLSAMEMKDTPGRADELKQLVSSMHEGGIYNDKEANNVNSVIDDVAAVRPLVPKYGKPEQRIAVMNELLNQRTMDKYIEQSGNATGHIDELKKESDERIQRIMSGKEPLYFINGNETNRDELLEAIDQHPDLLTKEGVNIKIIGDSDTQNKIKIKQDAIQKQEPTADDVRPASGDSQAMGGRDESQGAVDQNAAQQGAKAGGEKESNDIIDLTHADTIHDEENKVSGQNQVGLSDKGIVDAHELKDQVHGEHDISRVVSSDSPRGKETAEIVADGKVPVETRPGQRSWDLKDFSGMDEQEFKPIQKWFSENPNETVYQGDIEKYKGKELGESLNTYANRTIDDRKALMAENQSGTALVNHTNNLSIWNAAQKHGGWNEDAIKEFASSNPPEHAQMIPSAHQEQADNTTVDKIEGGTIPPEEVHNTVKLFVDEEDNERGQSVQSVHTAAARDPEDDGTPRQYSKGPSFEEDPGTLQQGAAATGPNQSGQPVSASGGPADPVRLTKQAGQLMMAGRTDDQVMLYLQRKGLDPDQALAVLGEAKAHPIDEAQKQASQKEVMSKYFDTEDKWLGRKDLNRVMSRQEARTFQDRIKATTPKGSRWQDVDEAIDIYLDTKRNPAHFKEFYDKLTPHDQKIADLSQNLTDKQKEIADDIKKQYDELGEESKFYGLIKDALENYVGRAWDMKNGKPATEESFKFSTSSRHQLQRTLDTKLQGLAEGMTLKIKGASNNLQILKEEIGNVIENRRHLEQGLALKYFSGENDANGKPIQKTLFSTTQETGYKKIENPAFQKWEFAGKLKDYPQQEAQAFGRRRDVLVTEKGEVMKKSPVYAPEDVAKSLNNILGKSALQGKPLIDGLSNFNAAVKQSMLSYSGFHFVAFTRAHELSAKMSDFKSANPISAYKTGLQMLADEHPYVHELIKAGMTINRRQDWTEGVASHNTWVGKQLDKLSATKAAKDKIIDLNTQFHKYLFDSYGAGLKMFDGVNLVKSEMVGKHFTEHDAIFKRVAKLMNDTYGGINWERMRGTKMQDPTMRHLSSLLLLAPDWTASNLRFAKNAIGKGDEAGLYRRTWARVVLRGAVLTTMANAIMAHWDEKDDQGNPISWQEAMSRRYSKAWDAGKFRSSMIDITPLYHYFGGDPGKRAYFSLFGAYTDPAKLYTPGKFLEAKLAFLPKVGLEALTGENWQGRQFTTIDELTGLDDKGTYSKTQTAHAKGDINSTTGNPYKRDQKGYQEGDPKGGKLKGELTKWSQGSNPGIGPPQLTSFILSQVRGMTPNAIQSFWQWADGENDATNAILNGIGSTVLTNKDPGAKQEAVEPTNQIQTWKP